MKLLAALPLACSALVPATASAQEGRTMEITRKADMKTVDGPAEYFTGKVTITGQFQRPDPSRVGGRDRPFRARRAHGMAQASRRPDADRNRGCWMDAGGGRAED